MRLLVVEDEHRIASSIKKGLEMEKYAVDLAYDGRDGLDLALTEDYDCIVLDLMLPGVDGLSLCRQLRQNNIHTPIIILTAKGQTQDKIKGLDAGADDYLTKPFSFEELTARIRALVRRPSSTISSVIKVGDLEMDTLSYQVKKHGRPLALSGKEYSLLEYLMRNAGRVVSKEQIISHVWNYDSDILPNTVEVYIKKLRQKIFSSAKKEGPVIITVRGFGYKIEK